MAGERHAQEINYCECWLFGLIIETRSEEMLMDIDAWFGTFGTAPPGLVRNKPFLPGAGWKDYARLSS